MEDYYSLNRSTPDYKYSVRFKSGYIYFVRPYCMISHVYQYVYKYFIHLNNFRTAILRITLALLCWTERAIWAHTVSRL